MSWRRPLLDPAKKKRPGVEGRLPAAGWYRSSPFLQIRLFQPLNVFQLPQSELSLFEAVTRLAVGFSVIPIRPLIPSYIRHKIYFKHYYAHIHAERSQ